VEQWNSYNKEADGVALYKSLLEAKTGARAGKLKSVGGVTINVNGRNINFMTTHFDPYSA
jgi:hypothetical protein